MTLLNRRQNKTAKHIVITQFERYQDRRLTEAETKFYERHLATCQDCKDWVELQLHVVEEFRMGMPPAFTLSMDATERIHRNLYYKMRRGLIMNSLKSVVGAVVAVTVLAAIVGVMFIWQSGKSATSAQVSSPPQETVDPVIAEQQAEPEEPAAKEIQQPELTDQATEEQSSDELEGLEIEGLSQGELNDLLTEAVRSDNLVDIEQLLESGANVDLETSSGNSILGLAASKGNMDMVKLLVSHGASINGGDGNAPLALAAQLGHLAIVEHLLDSGANVEGTISLEGKYENSTGLQWAAVDDNVELGQILIAHGANVNTIETLYNRTPLHGAAYYDSPAMVEFLLVNGADPEMRDSFGDTALHYAVSNGVVETARILIEHGAKLDTKDNLGRTLMDEAGTNSEMVQLLREAGVEE